MESNDAKAELVNVGITTLVDMAHEASRARGWWHDPITGLSLIPNDEDTRNDVNNTAAYFPYVIGTKIALIHSEASEGLEAYRTNAPDDKLPQFAGITAEMADVLIRVGDLMGCLKAHAIEHARAVDELGTWGAQQVGNTYDLGAATVMKSNFNVGRPDHALVNRRKPGGKKF